MDWQMKVIIALFIIFLILLAVFGVILAFAGNWVLAIVFFISVFITVAYVILNRPK